MYKNILRQYSNAYNIRPRYPNPFNDANFVPDDFDSDDFRMYSFKINKCPLIRAHDWTVCPYAHHGERARRRDLHKVPYVAVSCPDYRASSRNCPRGELCEFAHGVFEYWLHPTKYRTRICNAGNNCTRSVCFFAHSLEQLRSAETVAHLSKWVRLALRASLEAETTIKPSLSTTTRPATTHTTEPVLSNTSNTSGRREVGVIGRPRTTSNTPTSGSVLRELVSSSSSGTSRVTAKERPQELKLEFLESLRMLRISEYYNNNQGVQNNSVNTANVNSDAPGCDWVSDLLTN